MKVLKRSPAVIIPPVVSPQASGNGSDPRQPAALAVLVASATEWSSHSSSTASASTPTARIQTSTRLCRQASQYTPRGRKLPLRAAVGLATVTVVMPPPP